MNTKSIRPLAAAVLLLFAFGRGEAQKTETAAEPRRDLFVILDVSGSMNEDKKFVNVKQYLEREVVGGQLRTGDNFNLITFGDKAVEALSLTVRGEEERRRVVESVRALRAGSDFTDIGLALEKLFEVLSRGKAADSRQLILFITDGKHAPPPGSPYRGRDLAVDERFKDLGRKLAMNGWYLYVIGIGETDAKKIAGAVEGSVYRQTDPSLKDVKVEEYLAAVETAEAVRAKSAPPAVPTPAAAEAGPPWPLLAVPAGLVLALLAFFLIRLRTIELVISETAAGKTTTLTRKIKPGAKLRFNSSDNALPSFAGAARTVFSLERGLFGVKIRIEDADPIAPASPFKKKGLHKLPEAPIELKDGGKIKIVKT